MYYIQESLGADERLVYATRPHWIIFLFGLLILIIAFACWYYLPHYLTFNQPIWHGFYFHSLLAFFVFVVGLFVLLRSLVFYMTTEYGITSQRVIMKTGWLQRNTIEVFLQRIEGVSVNQTILGRLLNYGTLVVIGTGGTSDFYSNVPDPVKFHRLVQSQMAAKVR